jgi:hypothetical protein
LSFLQERSLFQAPAPSPMSRAVIIF